jgi:putative hemolysin
MVRSACPELRKSSRAGAFGVLKVAVHVIWSRVAKLLSLGTDPFDAVCDHLLVEHPPTGQIVGTHRLQTGLNAEANLGYYSA